MQFTDEAIWTSWVEANADPYGKACMDYARAWAEAMEQAIAANGGEWLAPDVIARLSHEADTDGITGFMYGVAVGMLSKCWRWGEELRRWHNLDLAPEGQGAAANERPGAVLNPAVLTIGGPDTQGAAQ